MNAMPSTDNIPFSTETLKRIGSLGFWSSVLSKLLIGLGGVLACISITLGAWVMEGREGASFASFMVCVCCAVAFVLQGAALGRSHSHFERLLFGHEDRTQLVLALGHLRLFFLMDIVLIALFFVIST
ncbi:MAG: hypothetical protein AAFS10_02365, partial [Myxococcota bacterium]